MNSERRREEATGLPLVGKQRGKTVSRNLWFYDGDRGHCVGLSFLCTAYSRGLPFTASLGGWCSWKYPVPQSEFWSDCGHVEQWLLTFGIFNCQPLF